LTTLFFVGVCLDFTIVTIDVQCPDSMHLTIAS